MFINLRSGCAVGCYTCLLIYGQDAFSRMLHMFINLRSGCAVGCYTCLLTCGQDVQ